MHIFYRAVAALVGRKAHDEIYIQEQRLHQEINRMLTTPLDRATLVRLCNEARSQLPSGIVDLMKGRMYRVNTRALREYLARDD